MSTQMQSPSSIEWEVVWEDFGMAAHETIDSVDKIAFALSMYTEYVESKEEGEEIAVKAIEDEVLVRKGGQIAISGVQKPTDQRQQNSEDEAEEDPQEMERSELEQEVHDLRKEMTEMSGLLKATNARMDALTKAVFGSDSLSEVVDTENMDDVWTRLNGLSDDVQEHEDKLHMFSKGGGKKKKPDERALTLRQVLYQKAKRGNDNVAKMSRDDCDSALGGGMTRYVLIDAMRRAANGEDADIDGSSDLENLSGVEIIIASGRDDQSKIRMDLDDATSSELRRIPTTKREGNEGR